MTARFRALARPGLYTAALALAVGLGMPSWSAAQQQAPQTATTTQALKDLPLTAAQRQVFIGNYTVSTPDGPMIFRIFEEEGVLKGQPGDDDVKRILYQGDNVFIPEGLPQFSLTFTVVGDKATKFIARNPEMVLEAVRTQQP